jgi:hypothetical protein
MACRRLKIDVMPTPSPRSLKTIVSRNRRAMRQMVIARMSAIRQGFAHLPVVDLPVEHIHYLANI